MKVPSSQWSCLFAVGVVSGLKSSLGFLVVVTPPSFQPTVLHATTAIEVCGFKDCRARGGGARLQKLITTVVEEEGLDMTVEKCDCQGECGYGPNILIDGKLVNRVQGGREGVLKALGVNSEEEA